MKNKLWLFSAAILICAGCADNSAVTTDFCPDDPDKTVPGFCGCGKADIDANHNGVMDCFEQTDYCPDDPNKTTPGVCGCGVADDDTDGDGYPDCVDGCKDDPKKRVPGLCGCGKDDEIDADGNHIPDCIDEIADRCPDDDKKTAPGACGCGIADDDTDGDDVPDCIDVCPNDPNKSDHEGVCGCGKADLDTDGDTLPDCYDQCPNDSEKILPGLCGCGNPDILVDTDSDGVIDCQDACPDNPRKTEAGPLGCDSDDDDNDGITNENDVCPFNPNISSLPDGTENAEKFLDENPYYCNLTKENGEEVFEIWTSSDFQILDRYMNERAENAGKSGLLCSASVPACDADQSMYLCAENEESVPVWQKSDSCKCILNEEGKFDGKTECEDLPQEPARAPEPAICDETHLNENIEGACCNKEFEETSTDQYLFTCPNGAVTRIWLSGGKPGEACDSIQYQESCIGSEKAMQCEDGLIVENTCSNSCTRIDENALHVACIPASAPQADRVKVKLMRDINLAESLPSEIQSSPTVVCVTSDIGGWQSALLYNADFDGQNHRIYFNSGNLSCYNTTALFSQVYNSNIHDLQLDLNVVSIGNAILATAIRNSNVEHVSWSGTALVNNLPFSILGEIGVSTFGVIAGFSDASEYVDISLKGSIVASPDDSQVEMLGGMLGVSANSIIRDSSIFYDRYQVESGAYVLYGTTRNTLSNVDVHIRELSGNRIHGYTYEASDSYDVNIQLDNIQSGESIGAHSEQSSLDLLSESIRFNLIARSISALTFVALGTTLNAARILDSKVEIGSSNSKTDYNINIFGIGIGKAVDLNNISFQYDKIQNGSTIVPLGFGLENSKAENIHITVKDVEKDAIFYLAPIGFAQDVVFNGIHTTFESDIASVIPDDPSSTDTNPSPVSPEKFNYLQRGIYMLGSQISRSTFQNVTFTAKDISNLRVFGALETTSSKGVIDGLTVQTGNLDHIQAISLLSEMDNSNISNVDIKLNDVAFTQEFELADKLSDTALNYISVDVKSVENADHVALLGNTLNNVNADNLNLKIAKLLKVGTSELYHEFYGGSISNSHLTYGDVDAATVKHLPGLQGASIADSDITFGNISCKTLNSPDDYSYQGILEHVTMNFGQVNCEYVGGLGRIAFPKINDLNVHYAGIKAPTIHAISPDPFDAYINNSTFKIDHADCFSYDAMTVSESSVELNNVAHYADVSIHKSWALDDESTTTNTQHDQNSGFFTISGNPSVIVRNLVSMTRFADVDDEGNVTWNKEIPALIQGEAKLNPADIYLLERDEVCGSEEPACVSGLNDAFAETTHWFKAADSENVIKALAKNLKKDDRTWTTNDFTETTDGTETKLSLPWLSTEILTEDPVVDPPVVEDPEVCEDGEDCNIDEPTPDPACEDETCEAQDPAVPVE